MARAVAVDNSYAPRSGWGIYVGLSRPARGGRKREADIPRRHGHRDRIEIPARHGRPAPAGGLRAVPGLQSSCACATGSRCRSSRATSTPWFSRTRTSTTAAICRGWCKLGFAGRSTARRRRVNSAESCCPTPAACRKRKRDFANRHGYSKHKPALPLYTEDDAREALRALRRRCPSHKARSRGRSGVALASRRAHPRRGDVPSPGRRARILFSGDLGRPRRSVMRPPVPPRAADYVVIESTYGDRRHRESTRERRWPR